MNDALVVLGLIWAALLVPGAVRSRNASPHATVGGFERAMAVLRNDARPRASQRGTGRQVLVPRDAGRIVERQVDQRWGDARASTAAGREESHAMGADDRVEDAVMVRRRVWFVRALLTTVVTLVLALAFGAWFWLLAGASLVVTGTYVAVLRRLKLQRDEARRVVHDLELYDDQVPERERVAVGADTGGAGWSGSSTVRLRRWDD